MTFRAIVLDRLISRLNSANAERVSICEGFYNTSPGGYNG